MMQLITVHNVVTDEFFIAPEHSNFGLGENWVPCSQRCRDWDEYFVSLEQIRSMDKEIPFPVKQAWVIIDGDKYNPTFLYNVPKNLWGGRRDEAKVFFEKEYAEKIALKMDSNAYEVTYTKYDPEVWCKPFIVNKWRDE